ncbi:hypothetical protein UA08_00472 [Talaromyces atroroseus]|uniref:Major facilitator superfamily (MFS) profile domain-containing protein n=1 Tax=Talaromyces atroroseus TaxID=1441469 RepID=A0A225ASE8_TALAT|nr:hypothetical protein UA08_00472 [Talaromyces atroroseus]OKL63920.1 hypothetical protein UA08_00472 [Talaromyces atroroseus]
MLIAGRAVQGAGGGGLVLLVNITISDIVKSDGNTLVIGMVWAVTSAVGPITGGALAEKVSWRWCCLSRASPIPQALILAAFSILTGNIIKWTGRYLGLVIGDLPAEKSWPRNMIFQVIAAIGLGPNFQAPLIALQTQVDPADMATATATFGFVRNLSSAMSVVIGGLIIQNRGRYPGIDDQYVELGRIVRKQFCDECDLTDSQRQLVREKVALSLSRMWILYCLLLFVGLLASLKIGHQELSNRLYEHKTGLRDSKEEQIHPANGRTQDNGMAGDV